MALRKQVLKLFEEAEKTMKPLLSTGLASLEAKDWTRFFVIDVSLFEQKFVDKLHRSILEINDLRSIEIIPSQSLT